MRRGEIWWARLEPPQGNRPVLLLSRDQAIAKRDRVTIAPLTRTSRGIPVEVRVGTNEGVARDSVISLDNLQTIFKTDLIDRITQLTPQKMAEVEAAVKFALGLR